MHAPPDLNNILHVVSLFNVLSNSDQYVRNLAKFFKNSNNDQNCVKFSVERRKILT
jgi:hypothetical protein